MPTPSPRLKLKVPAQPDRFSTQDLIDNWDILDAAPGRFICTSTTRPTTWGAAQAGCGIYETNTKTSWDWTGTAWQRSNGGQGVLKVSGGGYALGQRATNFSTGSTDPVIVVAVPSVVVPDGHRTLMIVASWQDSNNSGSGATFPAWIYQSNTANAGPIISRQQIGTIGGSIIGFIPGGLAAGNYDFSLQIAAPGTSTSTLTGTSTTPITLAVIEL